MFCNDYNTKKEPVSDSPMSAGIKKSPEIFGLYTKQGWEQPRGKRELI